MMTLMFFIAILFRKQTGKEVLLEGSQIWLQKCYKKASDKYILYNKIVDSQPLYTNLPRRKRTFLRLLIYGVKIKTPLLSTDFNINSMPHFNNIFITQTKLKDLFMDNNYMLIIWSIF